MFFHRTPQGLASKLSSKVALSIGNFDGVHLGHQYLLTRLKAKAERLGAKPVVVTFYPHPTRVLGRAGELPVLTPWRERLKLLSDAGIAGVLAIRFSHKLAELSAQLFLKEYLADPLDLTALVLGEDTALGKDRQGDIPFLQNWAAGRGIESEVVSFKAIDGVRVSSQRIRALIKEGDILAANGLLGRPYVITGRVRRGDQRGRKIGFPTANLWLGRLCVPSYGVYASRTELGGAWYDSITNIGVRPTFGGDSVTAETHLPDYNAEDFYSCRIRVELLERIRPEKKFSGIEELTGQIRLDCERARTIHEQRTSS